MFKMKHLEIIHVLKLVPLGSNKTVHLFKRKVMRPMVEPQVMQQEICVEVPLVKSRLGISTSITRDLDTSAPSVPGVSLCLQVTFCQNINRSVGLN